jgi:DNA (cytosine-5)-methyltransferase 1
MKPPVPTPARTTGGRPRLLDLFCGAGGASVGYHLAGFEVVGVDIEPQSRYPFRFVKADALAVLRGEVPDLDPATFDALHTSPPCQSESDLRHRTGKEYPDLLTPTLTLLERLSVPWVVENVASTMKLPGALVLCGTEFGLGAQGRWLKRHRRFGSNVFLFGAGGCYCYGLPIGGVYGHGAGIGSKKRGYKWGVAGRRIAMGIDWMNRDELSQAIPPAYTSFIGEQLLAHIVAGAA